MKEKQIVLVIGSPGSNKGSEAIVRGFVEICRKMAMAHSITLSSSEPGVGAWLNIPGIRKYQSHPGFGAPGRFLKKWLGKTRRKLGIKVLDHAIEQLYWGLLAEVKRADLVVFVGADNYDASYGSQRSFHELNRMMRTHARGRMLLYDCSLEKGDLDAETRENFMLFDAITARESITFDNFQGNLDASKVHYYPDPAFVMPADPVSLPPGWRSGNMVGVNVSNLVAKARYGLGPARILDAYHALLEYVIRNTGLHVALIPHVMKNADLSMLRPLYERFKGTGRVLLVEDETLKAPQLKYIISQCRFYVGARTHSTIAAYSTCVPTLVLGYSVKSVGIARDIFGTEKGMVLSMQDLKAGSEIADAFQRIHEKEGEIRTHLASFMPLYVGKAYATSELIDQLLHEGTASSV